MHSAQLTIYKLILRAVYLTQTVTRHQYYPPKQLLCYPKAYHYHHGVSRNLRQSLRVLQRRLADQGTRIREHRRKVLWLL